MNIYFDFPYDDDPADADGNDFYHDGDHCDDDKQDWMDTIFFLLQSTGNPNQNSDEMTIRG